MQCLKSKSSDQCRATSRATRKSGLSFGGKLQIVTALIFFTVTSYFCHVSASRQVQGKTASLIKLALRSLELVIMIIIRDLMVKSRI